MPPYKEQGIVLRSAKLGEADKIITILTQGSGKVRGVAKGIRKTSSRFGGRLEPFTHINVMLYRGRGALDTITQVEILAPHRNIRDDLALFAAGETMLEAVDKVAEEHERNVRLALLLLSGLRALDAGPTDPAAVTESFVLKLLSLSGFHPALTACAGCGSADVRLWSAASGGAVCADLCGRRRRPGEPGRARPPRPSRDHRSRRDRGDRRRGRPAPARGQGSAVRVRGVPPGAPDEVGADAREDRAVSSYLSDIDRTKVPAHVAIVMDGNGRWATQRGLPRTEGHGAGEEALWDTVNGAVEVGVRWLTVFAFSTENWARPPSEVLYLMNFNRGLLHRRRDELHGMNVRIRFIGRRNWRVPRSVLREIRIAEDLTRENTGMTLTIAFNYGGRAEVVDAVKELAREVAAGRLKPEKIDERMIAEHLFAADMPDPDLLIRTSGEMRTSNFLLWEAAYSELWFTPIFWPDFDREHLFEAIRDFQKRERRFGGLAEDA